ncbi:acyltransferase family protein [Cellulomonas chengniuliangii]|uniref:Acyltransferase n=1 Tax=Cellulomonas chengniuliangii TaxID=2968084 RepID=A0ABY5KVF2_9CELL|nr:acyltransferase [Cellulomonas chengniuliangii]MCC2308742.1 acyltransferase [Cellulomonas chengniuliangii]UUI74507.1 acyltransferase [Cellulomonas chengniuliangii]
MSASSAAVDAAPGARETPTARLWRWEGRQLDPKNNSLNLIRLVLAALVLVAHAYYIAGRGVGPHLDGENIGGWAVFGFFAISGYLITASRWSNSLGAYLVHRIARIYPAFLVCLVVTVCVFAPIGFLAQHGSLSGYLTTGTTPGAYLSLNATLKMNAYDVAATPAAVPYPGAWNGSLWSLYYEFLCYLVIAALAVSSWVRRSPWGVALAFAVSVAGHAAMPRMLVLVGGHADVQLLFKLLPLFLGGALVQRLRAHLPLKASWAAIALVVVAGAVWLLDGWGAQLTAPLIAYAILWVATVVPSPALIRTHDISYGVYIYAFPVQQLLAMAGVHEWGLAAYDVIALACTVPLAAASWLLVERPVMRRVRAARRGAPSSPTGAPHDSAQPAPALTASAAG